MKKSVFSQWLAVLLLFSALVWWASVSIREAVAMGRGGSASASLNDPTVVDTLKQLEQDLGDAMVAADIDKLNQIFADNWATVGSSGKLVTKESVLRDFKSGKDKIASFELGPMDVQVFGNVAVVHGGVSEKRTYDGKDVGGEGVYMDLLEKRAGKWVITRTAGASVKADSPSKDPNAVETLKQLERDFGDAMVAVDIDKLNQIYASDFASVRSSGQISTRESILADMKSGKDKLEAFELGPMDVQAVGDVAVVHGSVTEKRIQDGKEASGQFVWMDLLEKRAGKWAVVRSAGARVKS